MLACYDNLAFLLSMLIGELIPLKLVRIQAGNRCVFRFRMYEKSLVSLLGGGYKKTSDQCHAPMRQ